MNHFIVSAGLTLLFSLIASISAIVRGREGNFYRLFGVYWFSIAFWSFFVAFQFQLIARIPDFLWGWFLHLGCIFIPVLFFHFAVRVSGREGYERWLLGNYLVAVILNILNVFTPIFTFGVSRREAYAYPTPALIYPLYVIFFVVLVIWGTILLLISKAPATAKRGLFLWFLVAHILGYTGGMDNFLIMWDINLFPLYPYGLYFVAVYAIASTLLLSNRDLFRG